MGSWRSNISPRNNNRPGILYASDQCFIAIEERSLGSDYCSKWSNSFTASKVSRIFLINRTQLSLIQLGGGIAVGVQAEQAKYYTLLRTPGWVIPAYTYEHWHMKYLTTSFSIILITSPCRYGMLGGFFVMSLLPYAWPIMCVSHIFNFFPIIFGEGHIEMCEVLAITCESPDHKWLQVIASTQLCMQVVHKSIGHTARWLPPTSLHPGGILGAS